MLLISWVSMEIVRMMGWDCKPEESVFVGDMVGMPLCLNAPVAMPLLPNRNAPIAKSQCTHILEHCGRHGRNAPLLDGMPHFRDSRILGKHYAFQ